MSAGLLQEKQFAKANVKPFCRGRLRTPSGRIELYSVAMEHQGFPPMPTYTPLAEDGPYPFLFIPTVNHNFLNSTFAHNGKHAAMEKMPRLHMNAADAEGLGIRDGDAVKVWNGPGECELTAAVGEDVLPGVVVSQGLSGRTRGSQSRRKRLRPTASRTWDKERPSSRDASLSCGRCRFRRRKILDAPLFTLF